MDNKQTLIYPGTIFTAQHFDQFTKKVKSHPFVCVYNQALDPELDGETNILGLLITSNNKQAIRQITVLKAKNSFLDKDSYCYCNNIYMFLKKDITIIGKMDSETFFQIVKKRQLLLRGENDQCVQALMNLKSFESKKEYIDKEKDKEKRTSEINKANDDAPLLTKLSPSQKKNVNHKIKGNNNQETNKVNKEAPLKPINNKNNKPTRKPENAKVNSLTNQPTPQKKKRIFIQNNPSLIKKVQESPEEKEDRENFRFEDPFEFDSYITKGLMTPKEEREPFFKDNKKDEVKAPVNIESKPSSDQPKKKKKRYFFHRPAPKQ